MCIYSYVLVIMTFLLLVQLGNIILKELNLTFLLLVQLVNIILKELNLTNSNKIRKLLPSPLLKLLHIVFNIKYVNQSNLVNLRSIETIRFIGKLT